MAGVTADRVVVELEARLDRYEANVARAEAKFDKAMSGVQAATHETAQNMELLSEAAIRAGACAVDNQLIVTGIPTT